MLKLILALGLLLSGTGAGWAARCGGELAGAIVLEGRSHDVAYRISPATVVVGRHFAVEFQICSRSASPLPRTVKVDAFMPEHNHGMNYKPILKSTAGGYRVEGLMFHMPGRWEIRFDIGEGDDTERLSHLLMLQ